MRPPIVVLCDEVLLFEDVAEAEGYLEPEDVESGLIKHIYDRDGHALRPIIVSKTLLTPWRLRIEGSQEMPQPERFRDALIQLLAGYTNQPAEAFGNLSIDELIEKALPFKR